MGSANPGVKGIPISNGVEAGVEVDGLNKLFSPYHPAALLAAPVKAFAAPILPAAFEAAPAIPA